MSGTVVPARLPVPLQLVAAPVVIVSAEPCPAVMLVGLALILTVGGGVLPVVVVEPLLPPQPESCSAK